MCPEVNRKEDGIVKKLAKIIVLCVCMLAIAQITFAQEAHTLGVIAPKGADATREEWQPTVEYLAKQTGQTFRLVPLQLKSFKPAVADNNNINAWSDVRGKKVAALQKNALMGYQFQVYMLKKRGIEAGEDFEVFFAGTRQRVVKAVESGSADAGFAGAELLRWLEKYAEFTASNFKIIAFESEDSSRQYTFPSWIFGAAHNTDDAFAQDVAAALKQIAHDSAAAQAAYMYGWEDPADLAPVKEILKSLQ